MVYKHIDKTAAIFSISYESLRKYDSKVNKLLKVVAYQTRYLETIQSKHNIENDQW